MQKADNGKNLLENKIKRKEDKSVYVVP